MLVRDFSRWPCIAGCFERAQPVPVFHQPPAEIIARVPDYGLRLYLLSLGLGARHRFTVFHDENLLGGHVDIIARIAPENNGDESKNRPRQTSKMVTHCFC